MNAYIVYRHTSPSGKVYIGITKQPIKNRWRNGKGYHNKSIFKKAISKYGWEQIKHEVLLENQPESAAKYAEKYLIKWYKTHKISYNITDGGDGSLGLSIPLTKERKQHLRELQLGENNIMYGKHHSEETRHKISMAKKGKAPAMSRESVLLGASNARLKRIKKIYQFDLDGNFIQQFDSITDACKMINKIGHGTSISAAASGKQKTAFGYIWKYIKN